ncbi:MAG: ATP-binding protein [Muribaculaceae bacterium]|nr:ATP-binding protein [Muribaculaceae bacterium]
MEPKQLYPIGEQDFANIRNREQVYIDKTDMIFSLVKSGKYLFLSRPRRFGKSLLLSTLKYYFQGRRDLFEGLAIDRLETEWKQYPVLHLDMSQGKAINLDYLNSLLDCVLSHYERVYQITPQSNNIFSTRLIKLIEAAFDQTGMPVVVLIDEYDAPVLENLDKQEQMELVRDIVGDLYAPLKGLSDKLHFVFITGITKFPQSNYFSGLNNLNDISLLPQYEALCGITTEELSTQMRPGVEALAELKGVTADEMLAILQENYGGYHFNEDMSVEIYNPSSLIMALGCQRVYQYWLDSGTPQWLLKILNNNEHEIFCIDGISGDLSLFYRPAEIPTDLIAALYQEGSLSIQNYDKRTRCYQLRVPNREVRVWSGLMMMSKIHHSYNYQSYLLKAYFQLRRGTATLADFMATLKDFYATIPYDVANDNERHYQAILYAVLASFGADIRVEDRTSDGRADIVLLLPQEIYVMELKHGSTAQEAMDQLQRKDYAVKYRHDDRPVRLLAMNINKETRTIDDWLCQ